MRQKIKHVHSRGDIDTDKWRRHCYIRKCLNCGTRIRSYGDDKRYCNLGVMIHLLSYNRTEGSCVRPFKMLYKKKCKMCNKFKESTDFKFGGWFCIDCWKTGKIKRNMHTIKEKIEDDFRYL